MKLQTYKEYTVDYRLKQFRACPGGWENHGWIDFIDFDSEKGREILDEMIGKGLVPYDELERLL